MIGGIDGCPNAWLAIIVDSNGALDSHLIQELEDFLNQTDWGVAAIDIPIGLVDSGSRPCDIEARKLLKKRHSSVFDAPIRPGRVAGITPIDLPAGATVLRGTSKAVADTRRIMSS